MKPDKKGRAPRRNGDTGPQNSPSSSYTGQVEKLKAAAEATEAVSTFAACLWEPDDLIEVRLLPSGLSTWQKASDLHREVPVLKRANEFFENVFVGANPRKAHGDRKAAGVALARCLFADFDGVDLADARTRWQRAGLPEPTLAVNSGHGIHAYWRLRKPLMDLGLWTRLQKALAAHVASDGKINDPPRIMRVPGFSNLKWKPVLCQVLSCATERRYKLADLQHLIRPKGSPRLRIGSTNSVGDKIGQGERNAKLTSIAGSMRRQGMPAALIRDSLIAINGRWCDPPLPSSNIETIAKSIARYDPCPSPAAHFSHFSHEPPILDPTALHGLAGEFVDTIDKYTEAARVATLANLLVLFGNVVGPGPHAMVAETRHGCQLGCVLVGSTSKGRKGTSLSIPRKLLGSIDPSWEKDSIVSGLSSGEGLIQAAQAAVDVGNGRLLVIEEEFASPLIVARREGSTLSPVLRCAWDSGNLATLTRRALKVQGAHISILGHITLAELVRHLSLVEQANGFANRFLWVRTERSKLLPDGASVSRTDKDRLIKELRLAVNFARKAGQLTRDEGASKLWRSAYAGLSEAEPGLAGAVLSRAEAQILRLSMIYALMDRSSMICVRHLEAAIAVFEYCAESTRQIFGEATGSTLSDRIVGLLADGSKTTTELSAAFSRHVPSAELQSALDGLQGAGRVTSDRRKTGGRSETIWSVRYAK